MNTFGQMIAAAVLVTALGVASLFGYTEHNQVADLRQQLQAQAATERAIDKANNDTMALIIQDLGKLKSCRDGK